MGKALSFRRKCFKKVRLYLLKGCRAMIQYKNFYIRNDMGIFIPNQYVQWIKQWVKHSFSFSLSL